MSICFGKSIEIFQVVSGLWKFLLTDNILTDGHMNGQIDKIISFLQAQSLDYISVHLMGKGVLISVPKHGFSLNYAYE